MTAPVTSPPLIADDRSLAERLIAPLSLLPEADRPAAFDALMADLGPTEAAYLMSWEGVRRPSQIVDPNGDAPLVCLMGGKGGGKTRGGSEAICDRIEADELRAGAFVSRTPGDVRRVMIEGPESGFKVCAERRGIEVHHEPSKAQIDIVDGGTITLYSAEVPDSLRGPEHDTIWCLPAETMIATPTGDVPIERMAAGDEVLTRDGIGIVEWAGLTRRAAELVEVEHTAGRLRCTPDHRIWTVEHGWLRADEVKRGLTLWGCDTHPLREHAKPAAASSWPQSPGSNGVAADGAPASAGMARSTTSSGTASVGTSNRRRVTGSTAPATSSTAPSGNTITVLSRPATSFRSTTATRTSQTTTSPTSSRSLLRNTSPSTIPEDGPLSTPNNAGPMPIISGRNANRRTAPASSVVAPSRRPGCAPSSALTLAGGLKVVACTRLAEVADTYDLTIRGRPEFFADGVLVHNCDEFAAWSQKKDEMGNTTFSNAMGGLRLGKNPLGIFTTTPKALPAIRDILTDTLGLWRVARMTTWGNAANLPPAYLATLRKLYGGTRLAAQEFEGLYIEDVEGALWSTEAIETTRVHLEQGQTWRDVLDDRLPFRWVACDPSVAADGGGDECGITGHGVGLDRRYYMLGDWSGNLPPREWGQRCVNVFHDIGAMCVVAEGNQGGALITEVIHSIDPSVPVEIVHARNSKRARAEPIAALWQAEPGAEPLASIVGSWPELEAELTGWDAATSTVSPNRLDSMVWGAHKALGYLFRPEASWSAAASPRRMPV